MVDIVDKQTRSYMMSRIRGKWTVPEKIIHGYLKSRKVRHEMHPNMAGNPDIMLKGKETVVFVDGDFWHGKDYEKRKSKLQPFWKDKIRKNMERDKKHTKLLKQGGWNVVRIWEEDVRKRPEWCVEQLEHL